MTPFCRIESKMDERTTDIRMAVRQQLLCHAYHYLKILEYLWPNDERENNRLGMHFFMNIQTSTCTSSDIVLLSRHTTPHASTYLRWSARNSPA